MNSVVLKKTYTHTSFYIFFSLLLSLIFVRYALQIDIPRSILLIPVLIIVMFGNKTEIITMCMCCIPLHNAINLYYTLVLCIVVFVLKYYKALHINLVAVLMLVMIVWELLHSVTNGFAIIDFVSIFVPIVVLVVFICTNVSDCDYSFQVRMMAITTLAVCIMLVFQLLYFSNYNFSAMLGSLRRLGMNPTGSEQTEILIGGLVNPNTLGIICVLVSTGLLQLYSSKKGNVNDLLLVVSLLMFGILTSSKTFVVCAILMVVLFLFSQRGGVEKKIRFLFICILVLVCVVVASAVVFPGYINYLFNRFQVADITTGRTTLLLDYNDYILSNFNVLIYGIGFQNFSIKLLDVYKVTFSVPHNGFQELVVGWGIPGLLMVGGLLVLMVFYSKKYSGKRDLLQYIPLLILLAKCMVGQMLTSSYTMLAFAFAYLSLCQNFSSS